MQTPREIMTRCLKFECPQRIPRDLWVLPWAEINYPDTVKQLQHNYPPDVVVVDYDYDPYPIVTGDPYKKGIYVDEWNCEFVNLQDGIWGEAKTPQIQDISDWRLIKPPYDMLPKNPKSMYDKIKRFYERSDKFIRANCCPRPWERYQYLRGTENALIDVLMPELGCSEMLKIIHEFYLIEMELWAKSDVDFFMFMDDWGSQNQLLISPKIWRELFKPLYKEYCDLAHAYDKFVFMHSDGYITEIYEDIIEIGVDALNSQLFCMDLREIASKAKGKITFWGEIDRQQILPSLNPETGRNAVREVASHLYDPTGGVIAQFEFGVGAHPNTALAIFDEWERVGK